jgi:hypothetical protein
VLIETTFVNVAAMPTIPIKLIVFKPVSNNYILNLNSAVGSDEEPQDLDGERHEDFEGHILG